MLAALALGVPAAEAAKPRVVTGTLGKAHFHTDNLRTGNLDREHVRDFWSLETGGRLLRVEPQGRAWRKLHGRRVRAVGRMRKGRLVVRRGAMKGLPRKAKASATNRRVAILLVHFPDEPLWNPGDQDMPGRVAHYFFGTPYAGEPNVPTVADYYATQTYGTTTFQRNAGHVFGSYQIDPASPIDFPGYQNSPTPPAPPARPAPGSCQFNAWTNKALSMAAGDGFNFNSYQTVIIAFRFTYRCLFAGVGAQPGTMVWLNGMSNAVAEHEIGHSFGAPHASSIRCRSGAAVVAISNDCQLDEYGNPFDPMGYPREQEMTPWRKRGMSAIPAADAPTITSSGRYQLAPLERNRGIRMLRLPDGFGRFLDLSFRQPIGVFDGRTGSLPLAAFAGVTIDRDDPGFGLSVRNSELIDTTPQTAGPNGFEDAPLTAGKTFRYAPTGVSVTVESVGASGATVYIGYPPGATTAPTPAPTAVRRKRCRVPKLRKKSLKQAKKALRKANCRLGKVKRKRSRKVKRGRVISQSPKPRANRARGTKVKLVLSRGR